MRPRTARRPNGRRGVTLLEMLVVVALVVLMMLILASIFQAATGAMTAMRTYQELDDNLRRLDTTIRADLVGTTAKMTPPNNPEWKSGYFEYGENAPADLQGEDTDDYLAFTTRAQQGRVFTGRFYVGGVPNIGIPGGANPTPGKNISVQPVTITSDTAEVIYFLRNGNLYRRVLLVVPERRGTVAVSNVAANGVFVAGEFQPNIFGNNFNTSVSGVVPVGWYGANDISVRPNDGPDTGNPTQYTPIPNDLGDLSNRENRYARQRCSRDFYNALTNTVGSRDGILDDLNANLIPDYYPTLTSTQVTAWTSASATTAGGTPTLINDAAFTGPNGRYASTSPQDLYAFPFVFPGMYSKPEAASLDGGGNGPIGWLHALDTLTVNGVPSAQGSIFNHAPVEIGDSLPVPQSPMASNLHQYQTWFGFPTFRETASIWWVDPVYFPGATGARGGSVTGQQVHGLQTLATGSMPAGPYNPNFLPALGSMPPLGTPNAPATPFGSDGAGNPVISGGTTSTNNPFITLTSGLQVSQTTTEEQLSYVWDDDLIMTGVRSFDVKAFDYNAPLYSLAGQNPPYGADYYDLGYASTDYVRSGSNVLMTGNGTLNAQNIPLLPNGNPLFDFNQNPQGFGHEGRMPPLSTDFRVDPQRPILNSGVPNNVGDDSKGLTRIRRVWDSWSTDYTNAPAVDLFQNGSQLNASPADRPVYPSYPPPYPQPLRGIQIQIRVVDPKNEKIKVLTIRQDFSDKL